MIISESINKVFSEIENNDIMHSECKSMYGHTLRMNLVLE
jgi:hypothetical protein